MKKTILFLAAFLLVGIFCIQAQVMYTDDFESYTVGEGIAEQESTWWNTWSGTPGSAEDPTVSNTYAYSGTKSIKVFGSNDGVIEFDDLTTGRYRVEFYLYVPAGRQGYYNIMQNFNPSGAGLVWGMQVFIQNGMMTIDGAGEAAATVPYTAGTWIKVQHFIDLDNDWVDMYIDDVLVHAYQWSKGTFNDGSGINKLDAFDFYAYNDGGTCEYYMDNFLIEQVETPVPPSNFAYEIVNDNDVVLTWDAPGTGDPENYTIVRDGIQVGTTSDLTFTDEGLYPNDYEYQLYAYYGTNMGYSASAGLLEVTIPGGNERQFVVYEIFTGTWCQYCPTAAQAIDMMEDENLDVAIIEYHGPEGSDEFANPAITARMLYYQPFFEDPDDEDDDFGFPTTIMNGMNGIEGALTTVADMNEYYDYFYEQIKPIPAIYTISPNIEVISTNPYEYNVTIDVEETFHYYDHPMKLFVVLTESNIAYSWQTLNELNFVCRAMFPDQNGLDLDFSTETIDQHSVDVIVDASYDILNCQLVMFVQDLTTAEIMQASKIKMSDYVTTPVNNQNSISVYPNPANDMINLNSAETINSVVISNIAGQTVFSSNPAASAYTIQVGNLASGIYMISVETNGKSLKKKIVVE